MVCVEEGHTGRGERGLSEGMVCGAEVDFDVVADLCDDVFGVEVEAT